MLPPPKPVPWHAALEGAFAGDSCCLELGPGRVPMLFRWCPPGELPRGEDGGVGPVKIPRGFWLAQHPVNQAQWRAVMGNNPSQRGQGPAHPVDSVSWHEAQKFCETAGLRLPTEAEWEYACRAGTTTPFAVGDGRSLNAQRANFDGNHPAGEGRKAFKWLYREATLPEGSFPPNPWGLHEMHGQLWEWCEDEIRGWARVLRGGSWFDEGRDARAGYRDGLAPVFRDDSIGFRPCPSSTPARRERSGEYFWARMAFAFFQLPADAGPEVAAPLNRFLAAHRVVRVTRQWCEGGRDTLWSAGLRPGECAAGILPALLEANLRPCGARRSTAAQLLPVGADVRRL
jgi:hypothetical protein